MKFPKIYFIIIIDNIRKYFILKEKKLILTYLIVK